MKMRLEKESSHVSMVKCTSVGTVTKVSIRFVEREEVNKKLVMNTELNTKHAARLTLFKYYVSQKQNGFNNWCASLRIPNLKKKSTVSVFYSLVYLNSRLNLLKYMHLVISVILKIGNRPVRGPPECD